MCGGPIIVCVHFYCLQKHQPCALNIHVTCGVHSLRLDRFCVPAFPPEPVWNSFQLWLHCCSLIRLNIRSMTFQLNYWKLLYLCMCAHSFIYIPSLIPCDPHFWIHWRNCNVPYTSHISLLNETDLLNLNKRKLKFLGQWQIHLKICLKKKDSF